MARNSASRTKAKRGALTSLCSSIIEETSEQDFFKDVDACVTAYVKLAEYRKKLNEIRENDPEISESAAEFLKAEELDQQCVLTSEKLFRAIPAEHPLKKKTSPLHLIEVGSGDSNSVGSHKSNKKPTIPEFDGKNSSWRWWKIIFEKEVTTNTDFSMEHKYSHLLTSIKKNTFAHRIVVNYAGVSDAFKLAWADLSGHYSSVSDLRCSHLQGLRDLNRKFRVNNENDLRRMEDLYQTAWGHVKALEALGTDPGAYQALAIMGVRESLPIPLRVRFLREHLNDDFSETGLKNLFSFVKEELDARRQSRRMGIEHNVPQRSVEGKNLSRRDAKERPQRERKTFTPKPKKHSSMLQKDEVSDEDLNE